MRKLLHLIILGLLYSCNGNNPAVSEAKIEISRSQLSLGVNDVAILYLINKDKKEQTAVILDDSSYSAQLNFGNWEFAVILWEGTGKINSELKCGRVSKKFSSVSDSISINVNRENCDDSFFSPPSYRSNGEIKTLSLAECGDLSSPTCSPTGGIQSFRIRFQSHLTTSTSLMSKTQTDEFISSDCLTGGSYLSLPFGSQDFNPHMEIEAFSDSSCSISIGKYFFPNGVANFQSQTNDFKIISDSTNVSIFFKTQVSAIGNLVGCLDNEVITGFSGRAGAWIDQLGVSCQVYQNGNLFSSTETRDVIGGMGGDPFSENCPQGSAVASLIYWDYLGYTGKIQFTCRSISDDSLTHTSTTYGALNSTKRSLICPKGKFLRSLDYQQVNEGTGYVSLIGPSYVCR